MLSNHDSVLKWFADNGDNTLSVSYPLNEKSIVVDLGGYHGVWADYIYRKYNSNIYILEPVADFFNILKNKFINNNKFHLLNCGVSAKKEIKNIYINGDGSSTKNDNSNNNIKLNSIECKFITFNDMLDHFKIDKIDLLQINIEGDEYELLKYLIENCLLDRIVNIQIQFHFNVDKCMEKRNDIIKSFLENGFKLNFDYPFVWESWSKK